VFLADMKDFADMNEVYEQVRLNGLAKTDDSRHLEIRSQQEAVLLLRPCLRMSM
jgi:hypothetical protein